MHFAEEGVEVLDVNTRLDDAVSDEAANVFAYEQGSFSVSGTVVSSSSVDSGKYFIVAESGGQYYVLRNDGTAVAATYNSSTNTVTVNNNANGEASLWDVNHTWSNHYLITNQNGNGLMINGYRVLGNVAADLTIDNVGGNAYRLINNNSGAGDTTICFDGNAFTTRQYEYTTRWVQDYITIPFVGPVPFGGHEEITWENAAHIMFAKYTVSSGSGTPPDPGTYDGKDVDPDEIQAWLDDFFDDYMIEENGCDKTAQMYDYENRIYQVDITAKSSARTLTRNLDLAFSFDFSNSMLFPSTLTPVGQVELKKSSLEQMVRENIVRQRAQKAAALSL